MPTKQCWTCSTQRALNDWKRWKGTSGEIRRLELEVKRCVNCADNDYATKHNWRKARPLKIPKDILVKMKAAKKLQAKGEK